MAQCQDPVDIKIHKDLLLACGRGKEIDVRLLLQQGASLRVQDQDGRTCLHYAAGKGHKDVLKILLDHKVSVESRDKFGSTPLHQACANGHEEAVNFLISSGAKIDAEDEEGNTPLHTVAYHGCHRLIKQLCDNGARVNLHNKAGNSPLHIATQHNYIRCVLGLLKFGANLENKTKNGETALHLGIYNEHVDLVAELISFGADINIQNYEGNTPLHLCSEIGNEKMTKLILEQGTPFESTPNMVGDTAKDIAIQKGHKDIVNLIPSPKILGEGVRKLKKRQNEKHREKSPNNECSPSTLLTGPAQKHKKERKKHGKENSHQEHHHHHHHRHFVRHPSLEKIIHSDSGSSTTSLWSPVDASGFDLPVDWYWKKQHPMSPEKKTMKQLNVIEVKAEDEVEPRIHRRYIRNLDENGRPVRQHPRRRQRSTVLKGKRKKSKPQKGIDNTQPIDSSGLALDSPVIDVQSPADVGGLSDDRTDAPKADCLESTTGGGTWGFEAGESSGLQTTHLNQTKKARRKKKKGQQKGGCSTKSDRSIKGKEKEKGKEVKKSHSLSPAHLASQSSPVMHARLDLRKAGLDDLGKQNLKHWPEFQINDSDTCKTDPKDYNIKTSANLAELASKPYAANFAFAIHRLEKTSIQFEKDLNHTKHELEHKLHKLKKKLYDYMDVTDDRLDEAERCQDVYYHEIKEDLAGIKRSLDQQPRTDTTSLMEQVKFEIDESMRKWYSKLESRTCYDSGEGHASSSSSNVSASGKRKARHKKTKPTDVASTPTEKKSNESGDQASEPGLDTTDAPQEEGLRSPPQGKSDETAPSKRPVHPGDGDTMSVQRWYEHKLKDVEHYWKAKSDEEHDILKRRIKELEELLFKETGFHNTLV